MVDSVDKLGENPIQKTVLYRGFIPSDDGKPRFVSQGIDRIVENKLDPHSKEFADLLIWTTPDESYARGVAAMRFAVRFATDGEFRKKVKEQPETVLPSLAIYPINNGVNIFNAEEAELSNIQNQQDLPNQIVIEKIEPTSVVVLKMTANSSAKLVDILEKRSNMDDTAHRAVLYLQHETKKDPFNGKDLSEYSLAEMIKVAHDFYISGGMNKEEVEDKLAKGLFSYSSYMRSIADSLTFK